MVRILPVTTSVDYMICPQSHTHHIRVVVILYISHISVCFKMHDRHNARKQAAITYTATAMYSALSSRISVSFVISMGGKNYIF